MDHTRRIFYTVLKGASHHYHGTSMCVSGFISAKMKSNSILHPLYLNHIELVKFSCYLLFHQTGLTVNTFLFNSVQMCLRKQQGLLMVYHTLPLQSPRLAQQPFISNTQKGGCPQARKLEMRFIILSLQSKNTEQVQPTYCAEGTTAAELLLYQT